MANYKELRIMTHEQEFLVNTGQNTYALGNIDLTNVVFFTKSKKATYESAYEPFKVVDGGNYIISNQGTPSCSITFSTGFLDDKERIQVCREFLITSSQYITDEPNSIIVKDKLNQLISELTTLTEIIRKNQPKSDSKDVNHVFPDLLPNETFMMRDDGTLGAVTIDDVNSFIAEARTLINEHTTLKESELNDFTEVQKTELNDFTEAQKIELDTHKQLKETQLDTYADGREAEMTVYADAEIDRINATGIAGKLDKGNYMGTAETLKSDIDNNTTISANMGKILQDTKLNLTGGTLTGALNGTIATFSGNITAPNLLYTTDVINNLTSTSTTDVLSANMGKTLQDTKINLTGGMATNGTDEVDLGVKYNNLSTDHIYMYASSISSGLYSSAPGYPSMPLISRSKSNGVVSFAGGNYGSINGSTATFSGNVTASSITIGGYVVTIV